MQRKKIETDRLEDIMSEYDDIIDIPHYVSSKRKPMSLENRAAQFAPFAALEGHEEVLSETARRTGEKIYLSKYETDRLAEKLLYFIETGQLAIITYFVPDNFKEGGSYQSVEGIIKRIDEVKHCLILKDSKRIPLNDIYSVSNKNLNSHSF